jgi:hypothetical protein
MNARRFAVSRPVADNPRKQNATGAHSAHERGQQHTERNGGRADYQFQNLEPDNFVDEGSGAAGESEQKQRRIGLTS